MPYKDKEKLKEYRSKPKAKARKKEYDSRPENKAIKKEYYSRPEVKEKRKEYYSRPEVKEKRKEYQTRPKAKVKAKEYYSRPANKAKQKAYSSRPEVKEKRKEYQTRPERKAKRKEYRHLPENKARKRELLFDLKLEVFSHYSKTISNSDVPICACCKYDDIRALNIDHIIPISKLSASEKLLPRAGDPLWKYLKKNNYPKGFQILCSNCNGMKRAKVDCPHKFDKDRKYWK